MVAPFGKVPINNWIVHLKWVSFVIYKTYVNKVLGSNSEREREQNPVFQLGVL